MNLLKSTRLSILSILALATVSVASLEAKEDLFMGVAQNTGTGTVIMSAHTNDLADRYNTELVITGHCHESTMLSRMEAAGQKGLLNRFTRHFAAAQAGVTSDNSDCMRLLTVDNFVYGVFDYGIVYTQNDSGITLDKFLNGSNDIIVGISGGPDLQIWTELFMKHHNLSYRVVRYENSAALTAAMLSREVNVAYGSTPNQYWTNQDKFSALFTTSPVALEKDGVTVTSINEFSDFEYKNNSSGHIFLAINMTPEEVETLREDIKADLLREESMIAQHYATASSVNTLLAFETVDEGVALALEIIEIGRVILTSK